MITQSVRFIAKILYQSTINNYKKKLTCFIINIKRKLISTRTNEVECPQTNNELAPQYFFQVQTQATLNFNHELRTDYIYKVWQFKNGTDVNY